MPDKKSVSVLHTNSSRTHFCSHLSKEIQSLVGDVFVSVGYNFIAETCDFLSGGVLVQHQLCYSLRTTKQNAKY